MLVGIDEIADGLISIWSKQVYENVLLQMMMSLSLKHEKFVRDIQIVKLKHGD